jgi:RsiW-degrading membrane proteinase PrsW (M82 family)
MIETKTETSDFHWPTVIQVVLTGIAALISWGVAALVMVGGVMELIVPSGDQFIAPTRFSLFIACLLVGLLLIVPTYAGYMRLYNRRVVIGGWWKLLSKWLHPKRLLLSFPFFLTLGHFANYSELARWLLLPLINIYSLGLPVLIMVWLALRGLPKGTLQRSWGSFSLGLAIGPTVVLFLEILVLVLMVIWFGVSAAFDSSLMELIANLEKIGMGTTDPALMEQIVTDLFSTPYFLIGVLIWIAGFVPLIEEMFKPIAVWALAGRRLNPVDGWVIGSLSGAGFALFENLGNASISQDWIFGVLSRSATSVPHVFTAGLMGYTFALARKNKKYGQVFMIYLVVVAIHAVWNSSSVFSAIASLVPASGWLKPELALVYMAPIGFLTTGMVIATIRINRKLRDGLKETSLLETMPKNLLNQNSEQVIMETQKHGTDNHPD